MGYRSEVAIAITKNDYDEVAKKFAETEWEWDSSYGVGADGGPLKRKSDLLDMAEEKVYEDDGVVVLHWDGIKWYDSMPDINWLRRFVMGLDECAFFRLGEDYDDTESYVTCDEYDMYEYISISRSLEIA